MVQPCPGFLRRLPPHRAGGKALAHRFGGLPLQHHLPRQHRVSGLPGAQRHIGPHDFRRQGHLRIGQLRRLRRSRPPRLFHAAALPAPQIQLPLGVKAQRGKIAATQPPAKALYGQMRMHIGGAGVHAGPLRGMGGGKPGARLPQPRLGLGDGGGMGKAGLDQAVQFDIAETLPPAGHGRLRLSCLWAAQKRPLCQRARGGRGRRGIIRPGLAARQRSGKRDSQQRQTRELIANRCHLMPHRRGSARFQWFEKHDQRHHQCRDHP